MQEILLENGCTEDYGKSAARNKANVRLGGDGLESSDEQNVLEHKIVSKVDRTFKQASNSIPDEIKKAP